MGITLVKIDNPVGIRRHKIDISALTRVAGNVEALSSNLQIVVPS
jgi:hypothetical protein